MVDEINYYKKWYYAMVDNATKEGRKDKFPNAIQNMFGPNLSKKEVEHIMIVLLQDFGYRMISEMDRLDGKV